MGDQQQSWWKEEYTKKKKNPQRQEHCWGIHKTLRGQCSWRRVKEGTVEVRKLLRAVYIETDHSKKLSFNLNDGNLLENVC